MKNKENKLDGISLTRYKVSQNIIVIKTEEYSSGIN